ncbi:MAG: ornithine cyclodeaminase family protein [Rhodospirillaceae bacterium]
MLVMNRSVVARSLSHAQCIDVLEPAMRVVSQGDTEMPLRQFMAVPYTAGKMGLMPGYVGKRSATDPAVFGVKIVSKFPRELGSDYSSHVGAVLLFNAVDGIPIALLDGAELTAIRTSAASALATRYLANDDAQTLVLLGCGEEAAHHIHAIHAVRPLKKIIIWGRNTERARQFTLQHPLADDIEFSVESDAELAVKKANILCTVTSSTKPILKGAWLQPGLHVNLVGAAVRASSEADTDVVRRSRFYVDYLPSALAQAGELLNAIESNLVAQDHIVGEIGAVISGVVPGRQSDGEITVYKSLGVSAQDLAAGLAAVTNAREMNIGIEVNW